MDKQAVGFIGLGNIGKPMASNLIGDAFDVSLSTMSALPRLQNW